jgi:hypothetical protein
MRAKRARPCVEGWDFFLFPWLLAGIEMFHAKFLRFKREWYTIQAFCIARLYRAADPQCTYRSVHFFVTSISCILPSSLDQWVVYC